MNPTILVEEYKDKPEPERIATSVEQDEPDEDEDEKEEEEEEKSDDEEENIGYCGDDSDDIPFIDDEISCQPQCEIYIPPKMKEITRCGIMIDKNKKNNLGYRKTVSFDTSKDYQPKESFTSEVGTIPKSKTYDYMVDLEFNKPDSSSTIHKLANPQDRISVYFNNNDDIDYRNSNNNHNNQNTSNKIDINDITLDLTGLSSDSTTCSSSFGEKFYSNNSISVNVSSSNQNNINHCNNNNDNDFPDMKTTKDQFNNSNSNNSNNHNNSNSNNTKGDIKHNETPIRLIYEKQKSYDDLLAELSARNFNSGKVKALTTYFNSFQYNHPSMSKKYSASVTEISRNAAAKQPQLSETEKSLILKQLTEWSTFGTYSQNDIDPKTIFATNVPSAVTSSSCNDLVDNKLYFSRKSPPQQHQTPNLCHLEDNNCKYLENICNQLHNHQRCHLHHYNYHQHEVPQHYKSTPELNNHCYSDGRKKFPDAYIVKKSASGSNNKIDSNLNIKFSSTSLTIDKSLSINNSCPELTQTVATSKIVLQTIDDDNDGGDRNNSDGELPRTPLHSNTNNLTLKQIKNNFNKKFNRMFQQQQRNQQQQADKFGGTRNYFNEFKG